MSDLVVTVAVSAVVSGVVALGIEYTIRPRLDARKEELLELHRRRRELRASLLKIMTLSSLWAPYASGGAKELYGEMARAQEQLDELTRQLFDDIEWYAGTFSSLMVKGYPSVQDLVIRYIITVRAAYLSDMPLPDKLRVLEELTEPLQVALTARWPVTRVRALARLPRVIDELAPSPDAALARPDTERSGESRPADEQQAGSP